MTEIWIFGEGYIKTLDPWTRGFGVGDDLEVKYFNHEQVDGDMTRIEGTRPHLIVNISEPFDELVRIQRVASILHGAHIIDLY